MAIKAVYSAFRKKRSTIKTKIDRLAWPNITAS